MGKHIDITRRGLLRATGNVAGGAVAAFAMPASVRRAFAASEDTINIGWVNARSGPLSPFSEADDYVLGLVNEALKGGIEIGGKTYAVNFILKDTQSDPVNASKVSKELISSDGVDIVMTSSTPETVNPVADTCEAAGTPSQGAPARLGSQAQAGSHRVGEQIHPAEGGAQRQPPEGGGAQRRRPRCLVELETFDRERSRQRVRRDAPGRLPGKHERPAAQDHQGPQGIARILAEQRGKQAWETPRRQAEADHHHHTERARPTAAHPGVAAGGRGRDRASDKGHGRAPRKGSTHRARAAPGEVGDGVRRDGAPPRKAPAGAVSSSSGCAAPSAAFRPPGWAHA